MLKPLLTANWRYFAMLNFVVDSKILAPRVPAGTDPDFPQRQTYLSVVAFLFYHAEPRRALRRQIAARRKSDTPLQSDAK